MSNWNKHLKLSSCPETTKTHSAPVEHLNAWKMAKSATQSPGCLSVGKTIQWQVLYKVLMAAWQLYFNFRDFCVPSHFLYISVSREKLTPTNQEFLWWLLFCLHSEEKFWMLPHAFWMDYCSWLSQVFQCPRFWNVSKTEHTHLRSQILYSCTLLLDIRDAA